MDSDQSPDREHYTEDRRNDERAGDGDRPAQDGGRQDLPPREREDKADEIGGERQNPEQRERADVRRDVAGRTQHEARGQRRKCDPAQAAAPGERDHGETGYRNCLPSPCCKQAECTERSQDRKYGVHDRPHVRLLRERQPRFKQRRICKKAQEASCVGRGVEEIGIPRCCVATFGEPARRQ